MTLEQFLQLPGAKRHDGGPCPVNKVIGIEVVIRAGVRGVVLPQAIGWEWGAGAPPSSDIIAYREAP